MKNFIPLLIFTVLISCTTDKNSTPIPNAVTNLKLIKSVEIYSNYTNTANFTYSGNILSRVEETDIAGNINKTELNYVDNKLQSITSYYNGVLSGSSTYIYNGENITIELINDGGTNYIRNYTYNLNNQMINENEYDSNKNLIQSTGFKYNSQGNISNYSDIIGVYGSDKLPPSLTPYEYDTYKNPNSLVTSSSALMKILGESGNNISKLTDLDGSVTTYEFVYNDSGYPTQIIEKINGVAVGKSTFTYN